MAECELSMTPPASAEGWMIYNAVWFPGVWQNDSDRQTDSSYTDILFQTLFPISYYKILRIVPCAPLGPCWLSSLTLREIIKYRITTNFTQGKNQIYKYFPKLVRKKELC